VTRLLEFVELIESETLFNLLLERVLYIGKIFVHEPRAVLGKRRRAAYQSDSGSQ
jgi:hypothetical protein